MGTYHLIFTFSQFVVSFFLCMETNQGQSWRVQDCFHSPWEDLPQALPPLPVDCEMQQGCWVTNVLLLEQPLSMLSYCMIDWSRQAFVLHSHIVSPYRRTPYQRFHRSDSLFLTWESLQLCSGTLSQCSSAFLRDCCDLSEADDLLSISQPSSGEACYWQLHCELCRWSASLEHLHGCQLS